MEEQCKDCQKLVENDGKYYCGAYNKGAQGMIIQVNPMVKCVTGRFISAK